MIHLIIILVLIGVALYLLETYVVMDAAIKNIIRIVVIVCVVLWLLEIFGVMDVPIPRFK